MVSCAVSPGHDPQIRGSRGPFGRTRIGCRNVFRAFSSVHRSRHPDGETVIGDDGYFMAGCHVAHDCRLGSHVVICNNAALAGHVVFQDQIFVSGNVCVHQFCRVGRLAMVASGTLVTQDAPPFRRIVGARPARLAGPNIAGMRRAGVTRPARTALRAAYHALFRAHLPLRERLESVTDGEPEVGELVEFVRSTTRGVPGFNTKPRDA